MLEFEPPHVNAFRKRYRDRGDATTERTRAQLSSSGTVLEVTVAEQGAVLASHVAGLQIRSARRPHLIWGVGQRPYLGLDTWQLRVTRAGLGTRTHGEPAQDTRRLGLRGAPESYPAEGGENPPHRGTGSYPGQVPKRTEVGLLSRYK